MLQLFYKRTKGLDYWDVKFVGCAGMVLAFMLVRFIPELVDVNFWWWISVFVLFLLRPSYHFWIQPSNK
jgi:accessory gene regulator protein AgrB